jgi:hypothetical protein
MEYSFAPTYGAFAPVDESCTLTVNEKVPLVVGVPLINPLVDSDNPDGNIPAATVKFVYGATPPDAVSVWLYATLIRVDGSVGGAMVIVGVVTMIQ